MSRYFIGLMVPPAVREQLRPFIESIHANAPTAENHKLTWTHESDLHCTLLYIGEYADQERLVHHVEHVAQELPPVTMTLGEPTLWLGINLVLPAAGADHVGTAFIARLGHLVTNARAVERPFYGHVTLGKVRPKPAERADHIGGQSPGQLSWTAERVQVVESHNVGTGPRYRVVADVPFAQRRRR